jgi:hypothetical protein
MHWSFLIFILITIFILGGAWSSLDAKFRRYVREAAREQAEAEADLAKDFEDV